MKAITHKTSVLRFRYWSRKSYAVFLSIGKQVTIGRLKAEVTDALLGKQSSSQTSYFANGCNAHQPNESEEVPPEKSGLQLQETLLLITLQKPVAAPAFATSYSLYSMLSALFVGSIFFNYSIIKFHEKTTDCMGRANLHCHYIYLYSRTRNHFR